MKVMGTMEECVYMGKMQELKIKEEFSGTEDNGSKIALQLGNNCVENGTLQMCAGLIHWTFFQEMLLTRDFTCISLPQKEDI